MAKYSKKITIPEKEITFDELIKLENLYALCISFFNLIDDNKDYFIIKSEYRTSKFNEILPEKMFSENNILISKISELPFVLNKNRHFCYIKKNEKIKNYGDFFYALYKKIQGMREKYDDDTFSTIVLLSAFIPRGSMDIKSGNKLAVDIFRKYEKKEYLNQCFSLLTGVIKDVRQFNLNFRELQPESIENMKKEKSSKYTQLRINLKWFCDSFLDSIININIYKYETLANNLSIINSKNINKTIRMFPYEKLQKYIEYIKEGERYSDNTDSLRKMFGFDKSIKIDTLNRDYSIIKLAKETIPDICSGCVSKYELKDRTFKYKNSERWYLEINHVISFANNNVDQIDNLCKLCPICHKALTPNRTDELLQKDIIKSILNNNPIVSDYINLFIENTDSLEGKIDYIFQKLR